MLILTEAGHTRGYGHAVRCAALAQAFRQSRCNVRMWIDSDGPLPGELIGNSVYALKDWKTDLDAVLPALPGPAPLTVVDSYEADPALLGGIASRSGACCFFDDAARVDYPDGVLVNAAVNADLLYPVRRERIRYLTGPQYAVLRKLFWQPEPYRVREGIDRVLVFLGSAVSTAKVLSVARTVRSSFPKAETTVIHDSPYHETVKSEADGICWQRAITPEQIIELALHSDLAVCAGGQALLEMACLGIPTISLLTAENQKANVTGFEKAGFSVDAGPLEDPQALGFLDAALRALTPAESRARRSVLGRKLVDGRGAFRVAKIAAEIWNENRRE